MMYLASPPQYWVTFDWGNFSLESLFSWIRLSTSILYGLFLLVKKIIHQFHNITSLHHIWNSTSAKVRICDPAPKSLLGLCLGYLRGRSSPPPPHPPAKKTPSFPYKKYYHFSILVTILEKSSRHNKVIACTVTFLKIMSQNAPDCISAHIHFKHFPRTPSRKLFTFRHSGLLPQTINPR